MNTKRQSLEAAIAGLREYRGKLQRDIERLQRDLKAVDHSVALLEGQEEETAPLETERDIYGQLKPQDAVMRFLQENPNRKYRASGIGRELKRRGLNTKAKEVNTLITATVNRLERKGVLSREKEDKVWVYWIKGTPGAREAAPGV